VEEEYNREGRERLGICSLICSGEKRMLCVSFSSGVKETDLLSDGCNWKYVTFDQVPAWFA
jgi:hypothetical protein